MQPKLRFGPAGMPISCKGRTLAEGIQYVKKIGLNAFEVEFVRGVRLNAEMGKAARAVAEKNDVLLSCHGPYWINCCSPLKEKQNVTKRNILQTVKAAPILGARIIVFHPGYYQKQSAEKAEENCINLLHEIVGKMKAEKINVLLGLETTGKKSAFGSLSEVLDVCKKIKYARPVIDFAHLHARDNGCIKAKEDYEKIFTTIKKELGITALRQLHCHFTEVEFSDKGERYHLAIGEKNSPPFKPLAELIKEKKYKFTIISESPLLEKDALKMQKMCE